MKNENKYNKLFNSFEYRHYLFLRILKTHESAIPDLVVLCNKYRLMSSNKGRLRDEAAESDQDLIDDWDKEVSLHWRQTVLNRTKNLYIKGLADKKDEFTSDIKKFCRSVSLSNDWFLSVAALVLRGVLCPPIYNLRIFYEYDDKETELSLRLNPSTTIQDIEAAWPEIQAKQKVLYPSFKKINFTKKSYKHLQDLINVVGRFNLTEEERNPGSTYYERELLKRGMYGERNIEVKQSGGKIKHPKVKSKKTYREIARITNPRKSIKKEANRLIQLRKRWVLKK